MRKSARRRVARHDTEIRNVFLCLLCVAFTLIVAVLLSYGMPSSTKTVTFNQAVLMERFVTQMSQYTLSDEALRAKTDAFGEALRDSVQAYASKHHALVLNAKHVMAGGVDVTDEVARLVASRMQTSS